MKIEIRLMRAEDLPQILEIEQSWDYLSKWGAAGFRTVLSDPRIYVCLVAEDWEAPVPAKNPAVREKVIDRPRQSYDPQSNPSDLSGAAGVLLHRTSHLQGVVFDIPEQRVVAGFAVMALLVDHCELCNLVVPPAYLSKKVGYSLLQQCFEIARLRGIEHMFLEVRQSNRRAIEFYERNGFQITSQRKNYYRNPSEHAWIMERRLERKAPEI